MPRPGPRRQGVALRLSAPGIAAIDKRAADRAKKEGLEKPNRSDEARIMLAYAEAHMPKNWRPTTRTFTE